MNKTKIGKRILYTTKEVGYTISHNGKTDNIIVIYSDNRLENNNFRKRYRIENLAKIFSNKEIIELLHLEGVYYES